MAQLKNISAKDHLSLDNVCYLVAQTFAPDSIGRQIATEKETMCFCAELAVPSSESFRAGQDGIKSELCLLVDTESYNSEEIAKYNDVRYAIYRTYPRPDGMTELYLSLKAGV